ncbi:hypothetical protein VNO78_20897 [Psophocarpus tetragonolobus]|uniref:Uncharacterized protein n=1 Tax=Psophocarpus tetragonolobus TaxID=3891 RepID=A0AAN9SA46_PSOTE
MNPFLLVVKASSIPLQFRCLNTSAVPLVHNKPSYLYPLRTFHRSFIGKIEKGVSHFVHRRPYLSEATSVVPDDVREGSFAVLATKGEETKRFIVGLHYLNDPAFLRLLNQAEEEFGFKQKGALAIPCQPQELQNILDGHRV